LNAYDSDVILFISSFKIVKVNLLHRIIVCWVLHHYPENLIVLCVLAFIAQVLDASDGMMARRYKMGSRFGAHFDLFTDYCFGFGLAYVILPKLYAYANMTDFVFGTVFAIAIISFSTAYNNAEKGSMKWEEYVFFFDTFLFSFQISL
jgi:phosphatidylglycerophosphate synthase